MSKNNFFSRFVNPYGLKKLSPFETKNGRLRLSKKRLFKLLLIGSSAILAAFIVMIVVFSFDLPKPGQIAQYHPTGSTKIYDRNGKILNDIYGEERRTVIGTADMPKAVKDATVAIEDRYYYSHHGVNFRAIARAIFVDVVRRSKSQGGSTITQQLVRNAIDNVGKKKSFTRKIKEVILALEFEQIHSKDEIITLYLNEIPYGNNFYGIESASLGYFGIRAKELDPTLVSDDKEKAKRWAQIAMLTSLPQAPTYYNPYGNHNDQLKSRRDIVLQKLADQGYISNDIAKSAKTYDVLDGVAKSKENITAPHFVFYIREQLVDLLGGGQVGERRLASEGYKVTTTLDLDLQREAEKIISNKAPSIFKSTQASNAALVSTDTKTGQILAMVGSVDYNEKKFGSVNVTTANRQPGSSFKPIVYASLFKKNWSPGSTIFDLESTYDQSRGDEIWPHNYSGGGRGPLTIRNALGQSLNISAIKAQALAGTKEAVDTARDLGISTLEDPEKYGLAMVLGAAEVKMVDMVGAYSVFANNGDLHPVSGILKIEDQGGQVIQEWRDQPKQVLDSGIAYEISSILSDNDARTPTFGARSPLTLPGRVVAAKTGTTSNYRDAWTIGFTPQITTAVWVGNNNNKEMTHSGAGAMAAAPIWHDFMVKAHENKPEEQFTRPDSIKDCTVAKYSNKRPTDVTPPDNIIRDLCTEWQNPTEDDDAWKTVRLYKPDQTKLANDTTPPSLIATKVFTTIHSERPTDAIWENPVLRWANDNGISSQNIPTDTYDPNNAGDRLSVSIVSPSDGTTQKGKITLQSFAESKFGVSHMLMYIDDILVAQPNAPWTAEFDTSSLVDGRHTFKVVARDLQDQEESASVIFISYNSATVVDFSNLSAVRSTNRTSVTIFWTTTTEADGLVEYGSTSTYGTQVRENKGEILSHTVVINGLDPVITYHYRLTSKNSARGISGSTENATF